MQEPQVTSKKYKTTCPVRDQDNKVTNNLNYHEPYKQSL